jgi:hypothetical protein
MTAGVCIGLVVGWMLRGLYTWQVHLRGCIVVPKSLLESDDE